MSEYKYKNEPIHVYRDGMIEDYVRFTCNHMSATIDGNIIKVGYRGCDDGEIPLDSIWHLDEIDDMCKALMAAKAELQEQSSKVERSSTEESL